MLTAQELNNLKFLLDSKSKENIDLAFQIGRGIPRFKRLLWKLYPEHEFYCNYLMFCNVSYYPCKTIKDYFRQGYHHYTQQDYYRIMRVIKGQGKKLSKFPNWFMEINASAWDLSGNQLNQCPVFLCKKAASIIHLNLKGNQIQTFPNFETRYWSKLKYLNLSNNKLIQLKSNIKLMANLDQLVLRDNCLKELPAEMASLEKLRLLSLCNNQLTPSALTPISNLKWLYFLILNNNTLRHLDKKHLPPNVTYLYLRNTGLEDQDLDALAHLKDQLCILDLSYNKLTKLPEWLKDSKNLLRLFFYGNPIKEVPDWFSNKEHLWSINDEDHCYPKREKRKNQLAKQQEKEKKNSPLSHWLKRIKYIFK